jgi:hypothetical protein
MRLRSGLRRYFSKAIFKENSEMGPIWSDTFTYWIGLLSLKYLGMQRRQISISSASHVVCHGLCILICDRLYRKDPQITVTGVSQIGGRVG